MIAFLDASNEYTTTELEEQCEDEGFDCDTEASLGATTAINQDRAWVDTWTWGMEDCELDDADNEANGDDEPSLGWSRSGAIGDTNDLESAL